MEALEEILKIMKSRAAQSFHKASLWLKPSYLRKRLLMKERTYMKQLFHIRPDNENDYYTYGRWRIGKKLALCLVVMTGLAGLACILVLKPEKAPEKAGHVKAYRYNALPLKFIKGETAILGKSGYLAYLGEVEGGAANGKGTLYAKNGDMVYCGEFVDNRYQGQGKRYYAGGGLWYEGTFADNRFEGEGSLYRENGTLQYTGEFEAGQKEGAGVLYDGSGSKIYEGSFFKDRIIYEALLGKTAQEISAVYGGRRILYSSEEESCVWLPEIEAIYRTHSGEDTLEGEWTADGIYVLQGDICLDGRVLNKIPELNRALGAAAYEGNTRVTMPEAAALNAIAAKGEGNNGQVHMEMTELLEDCYRVDGYDSARLIYLYRYDAQDCIYTFFSSRNNNGFDFYLIEAKNG